MIMEFHHIPVLLRDSIEALAVKPDGIYVDCTAGGGGHSELILKKLDKGKLVLIDRDPDAVKALSEKFGEDGRVSIFNDNFSNIDAILHSLRIEKADGILADLGVSSFQLDNPKRGFSFHTDAPLDMRMSKTGISAYDVVNTYTQDRLSRIIFSFGEEKYAGSIARNIVRQRAIKPIETTLRLVEIIRNAMPKSALRGSHPARRTFQAIRIEVNGELETLKNTLPLMFGQLCVGGVLAIITFHSLEDRIVKDYFQTLSKGCTCPRDFPVCVCGGKPKARVKSRGVTSKEEEISKNPRSRSAKLRTAVKL
ncbi:MAG: Ribosomal RNA small subunit methyltransferase H [Firmicutes bacterium ADurb.Bin300]|nr:MAG: Ribosomal RNA small subunit methyltransferase H [Firmicutes bacterium ADurb.Bin300]